ncbi:hypothetical protein [Puerhibacterium puerhi]|uniref:hypothetical protein n=1 Tax=Puerhibacterium puerhi TaxID=2692623 RepID=UPI001359EC9C|nr:hypothetical protein [Puerhibacterium puerhi]
MAPRGKSVILFGAGTELVLDWEGGDLYIETPVDDATDDEGLAAALAEAKRQGLEVIPFEEIGEVPEVDDCLRLYLTPTDAREIEGWL